MTDEAEKTLGDFNSSDPKNASQVVEVPRKPHDRAHIVGRNQPDHPRRITAAQADIIALELRKSGMTYPQIGTKMGVSRQQARAMVKRELDGLRSQLKESAAEVLEQELARLDELFKPMYEKGTQGDRLAVDRCLAIMERRAAYLGLDAPVRIRQEIITDDQLEVAIAKLEEANEKLRSEAEARDIAEQIKADVVDADVLEDWENGE